MDYQNNPDSHQPGQELFSPYKNKRSAGFATASLVLGILSLVTCCCIYSALPFGALAIIFALLSRGGEMTMDSRGMTGLGLGIAGLVLTIVIFIIMFIYTVSFYGGFDAFMQYTNELAEQYMQMQ
jgi:hypothetical protein